MHMMLDLETLALDPRAIVFQIGVVVFDMQTGEMPVKMRLDIDILPQIMRGRIFDAETQKWWMTQPKESWDRWPKSVLTVTTALEDINALFKEGHIQHVWANSPSFDCVILRSLAKDFATDLAWDFRSEMDVRTIKTMNSLASLPPADPFETTHDALKDCIDQVHKVRHYWSHIIGMEQQDIVTTPG
jgi:hypothetical protein